VSQAPARASAIVLAGGRSARFGSDKLAAELGGAPLLHHALRAVASTCDEVIVIIARDGPEPTLPTGIGATLRVVRDRMVHPGPLAALLTGAGVATGDRLLVVGGDMPSLRPPVLARLVHWTRGDGACLLADDRPQALPFAADRETLIREADPLLRTGDRSLRALLTRLDLERIPEAEWRVMDPVAASLSDVDRPEDLASAR
jgi:molybdopterin-guanine dinucleotide biosynthesis protein A